MQDLWRLSAADLAALVRSRKVSAREAAKAGLRDRLVNTLITTAATTERKLELVAQLKLLEELTGQFKVLINDYNAGVASDDQAER